MAQALTNAALAALHKSCFTMPRPWSETEFAGLLSLPDVFVICGAGPSFSMGRVVVGEAELLTLAVAPSAQGQGLGRTALQAYETAAIARSAETSFLEVAATNTTAIALYQSHGYSESGKRRAYYTGPNREKVDALVLSKPLP
jgi:ribosomal-protein-alanine N-acetyltransferase